MEGDKVIVAGQAVLYLNDDVVKSVRLFLTSSGSITERPNLMSWN